MTDLFPSTIPESVGDRDSWATPHSVFVPLHDEFAFTLDPCAEAWSAKIPCYYSRRDDGLAQSWTGERVFLNAPFSDEATWLRKAVESDAALVVWLGPASVNSRWWHQWIESWAAELRFPEGRIQFIPPPGIKRSSNDTDCAIAIFREPSWRSGGRGTRATTPRRSTWIRR